VKLRKQASAKAFILATTAGLMAAFLVLIRANPGIEAETEPPAPAPNFDRFFAPPAQSSPETERTPAVRPHTRTRAS
jgi:hypothetical protein